MPTLQFNVIKYREDENFFTTLLRDYLIKNDNVQMKLATGYLNLQAEFLNEIFKAKTPEKVQLLTSSPRANGFYRAGFVKKYIPGLYRVNEEKLLKRV